jgi:hypothetical protein
LQEILAPKLVGDSDTNKSEDLCKKTPDGCHVAGFLMVRGKGVWWSPLSRSLQLLCRDKNITPSLPHPLSLVIGITPSIQSKYHCCTLIFISFSTLWKNLPYRFSLQFSTPCVGFDFPTSLQDITLHLALSWMI